MMKKVMNWVLLAAAMSFPGVVVAQDEPAGEETAAVAGGTTEETLRGQMSRLSQKLDELRKGYEELQAPSASVTSRLQRNVESVERSLKRLEELVGKIVELELKEHSVYAVEYQFSVIPMDQRTKYEEEVTAQLREVIKLLGGKESDQIRGFVKFEKLRETAQGVGAFKEASDLYNKAISRLERKWRSLKDKIEKDRAKMNTNKRAKAEEVEEAQVRRLEQKLSESGLDFNRDWFAPGGLQSVNLTVLDRVIQRAKQSMQSQYNRPVAEYGQVPEKLSVFWATMDEAVRALQAGNPEKASDLVDDNKALQELSSMHRCCMPDELKNNLRKEVQEFKSRIRSLSGEAKKLERDKMREMTSFEREQGSAERVLERMQEDLSNAREDAARRAEEEAERKAAEEEARREAEEEEEEEEEVKPKPAPKKGKKASSTKK
ncbi:MAG: hypothetical protein J1E42_05800 [Akkermansiaceae bacterium]|nr:hypothetical protein [Akkermansiaceae bacterium]